MKKSLTTHLALLVLCISLTALLAACGTRENPSATPGPEPSAKKGALKSVQTSEKTESEPENDTGKTPEKIVLCGRTWIHTEYSADKERIYRIILDKGGYAQLVVQDGVGNLIDLSAGRWSLSGAQQLVLDLTTTRANGEELADDRTISIGGTYSAVLREDDKSLTLGIMDGASPLVPVQKDGPVIFYDERYTPEEMELLCNAVLNYYAAQNGEPYPGKAIISEIGDDGVRIQLAEDMGDHIATAGWYLIAPDTFLGTDEVLGGVIDFSNYIGRHEG